MITSIVVFNCLSSRAKTTLSPVGKLAAFRITVPGEVWRDTRYPLDSSPAQAIQNNPCKSCVACRDYDKLPYVEITL